MLRYAQAKGAKRDVTPELYLAVAIHKVPDKAQEALLLFSSAFEHLDTDDAPAVGPRSELWARASWARLLRRLERVAEAEAQEQLILYVLVILHVYARFTHYSPEHGSSPTRLYFRLANYRAWSAMRLIAAS